MYLYLDYDLTLINSNGYSIDVDKTAAIPPYNIKNLIQVVYLIIHDLLINILE